MSDLLKDRPDVKGDITSEQDPALPESKQPQPDTGQPASPADTGAEKGNGSGPNDDPEVDAKTRANREDAEKSTGPRTPAGREASSKNAVKHGLFAEDLAQHLSEEQMERYQGFVEGIVKDLHPEGDLLEGCLLKTKNPMGLASLFRANYSSRKYASEMPKKMAQYCTGDGIVEKKVVATLAGGPKKAA
jgi:hypothetical protein